MPEKVSLCVYFLNAKFRYDSYYYLCISEVGKFSQISHRNWQKRISGFGQKFSFPFTPNPNNGNNGRKTQDGKPMQIKWIILFCSMKCIIDMRNCSIISFGKFLHCNSL